MKSKNNKTIQGNILEQIKEYADAGDEVVRVFEKSAITYNYNRVLIQQNSVAIITAMLDKINTLMEPADPNRYAVSNHIGDYQIRNVFDISANQYFVGKACMNRFVTAAISRVTRYRDERSNNFCFHLEITQ